MRRGAARRAARGWAIAASLAAHAVALALLAWTTPIMRLPLADWRPDVTIELNRPAPLERPRPKATVAAPRAASAPTAASPVVTERRPQATPTPPRPIPVPVPSRPAPPIPAPAPKLPAPALPAPPVAAPGPAPRPAPPAASARSGDQAAPGGDVRGAVRAAIGCNHEAYLQLNAAEKEVCDRKLAEAGQHSGAYVDPIPPLKRGAFDRQAAADARRRDHDGPMRNPIVPCPGGSAGSNFGLGCLPPEAMHSTRIGPTPRASAPDPEP